MEIAFGNFRKFEISWKIAICSLLLGLALHFCEWTELFVPSLSRFCPDKTPFVFLFFFLPFFVSAIIGYIGFKSPAFYWILFTIPSWIAEVMLIVESRSNLFPIVIGIYTIFLILTGIIMGFTAWIHRRQLSKRIQI